MNPITSTDGTGRRSWRVKGAALAAATALVFVAACSSSSDGSSPDETTDGTVSGDVLGTPNAASGEAVKVGFISDGRTASIDNSQMLPAAKATVEYLNAYKGGLAGRPIELVGCETAGEPGKATDCANQLVQDSVAMVIMPETQQPLAVHTVIAANDIPLFVYGVADPAITEDAKSSFMIASQTAGLSELPIAVAQENDIDNVSVIVVDVPSATAFFDPGTYGASQFENAGIELNEIKVPLGSADLTQQINKIVQGGPTVVHIIGDPATCISAINGLKTNGYTGPVTTLNTCTSEAVTTAVGENMDGVIVATPTPTGDEANSGIQLYHAILDEYAPSYPDPALGLTTFITVYSAFEALQGIDAGALTPANIESTIKAAPQRDLVTGAGLGYRCNGKASPPTPAVCTRGALRVALDAKGKPKLPYVAFGTSPIPD
jgi:branched-chain amino acid transport system substrate-binding protein